MNKPMMKCGHAANAESNGKPCCAICAGFNANAFVIAEEINNLEGRFAKCSYCGNKVPSNNNLIFFKYQPDQEFDSYYCGCGGWD